MAKGPWDNGIQGFSFLNANGDPMGQCINCAWYNGGKKCDAFPDGIPQIVFDSVALHNKPIPGDNGFLWAEPITLEPMANPVD